MARQPMVTRTITTTQVNVLCLDVLTGEPSNRQVTIPRTYKTDDAILKVIKPMVETDTFKVVHVVDKVIVESLYGMREQDFIAHATQLPARKSTEE